MRIIHFVNSLGCGGAENLVLDLSYQMQRQGHQVLIISLSDKIEYQDKLQRYGLEVITCGFAGTIYHWRALLNTQIIIRNTIKEFKPDILHSHIFLSDLFARINKPAYARLITTLHSNEPWWNGATLKHRLKTKLEGLTARRFVDRFISVSERAKTEAINALGIAPESCVVVMNGVDIASFSQTPRRQKDKRIIIQVARFYPEKAHDLALLAFAEVTRVVPNTELWLVGDGPLKPQMEQLAVTLHLEQQIKFLGIRQDVADLLAQADIFLLSSNREGLPISVLEAMAAGLPIVTTKVGEIPKVITEAETGLLVEPGNQDDLVRQLLRLLQDATLAEQIAQNGHRLGKTHYSIDATAKAYLHEYEVAGAAR